MRLFGMKRVRLRSRFSRKKKNKDDTNVTKGRRRRNDDEEEEKDVVESGSWPQTVVRTIPSDATPGSRFPVVVARRNSISLDRLPPRLASPNVLRRMLLPDTPPVDDDDRRVVRVPTTSPGVTETIRSDRITERRMVVTVERRFDVRCPPNCYAGQRIRIHNFVPVDSPGVRTSGAEGYDVPVPAGAAAGERFWVTVRGRRLRVAVPAENENKNNGRRRRREFVRVVPRFNDARKKADDDDDARPKTVHEWCEVVAPDGVREGELFEFEAKGESFHMTCPPNFRPGHRVRFPIRVYEDEPCRRDDDDRNKENKDVERDFSVRTDDNVEDRNDDDDDDDEDVVPLLKKTTDVHDDDDDDLYVGIPLKEVRDAGTTERRSYYRRCSRIANQLRLCGFYSATDDEEFYQAYYESDRYGSQRPLLSVGAYV